MRTDPPAHDGYTGPTPTGYTHAEVADLARPIRVGALGGVTVDLSGLFTP